MGSMSEAEQRSPRLPWRKKHDAHTPHVFEWTASVGPYELRVWRPVGVAFGFTRAVYLRGGHLDRMLVTGAPRNLHDAMVQLERCVDDQVISMQLALAGGALA